MSNPSALQILHDVFGYTSFKGAQQAIVEHVCAGGDALVLMPTGGGKSLCYQLPALLRDGVAIVVSPLIALMQDQVDALQQLGVKAAFLNSSQTPEDARAVNHLLMNGELQILYVAPERLMLSGFLAQLEQIEQHTGIALFAIDEAHCISQWGHDFRPDYRTLGQHLPSLRPAPVSALTATATPVVQRDIAVQLGLGEDGKFIQGFRRENIAIEVMEHAIVLAR